MRLAIVTLCAACRAAPQTPPAAAASMQHPVLEGTVVDPAGEPVAGAEIVLCSDSSPCDWLSLAVPERAGSVRELLATAPAYAARTSNVPIATSDAGGAWRIASPVPAEQLAWVFVLAADHVDAGYFHPSADQLRETTLPRAVAIDLVPTCSPAPCPDPLVARLENGRYVHGTHFEHVSRHAHTVDLVAGGLRPGEQHGNAAFDASDASSPLTVPIALAPTGSGLAITGTMVPDRWIEATCGEVVRRVQADASGHFQIDDAGAPPCELHCATAREVVEPDRGVVIEEDDPCACRIVDPLPASVVMPGPSTSPSKSSRTAPTCSSRARRP